jgi:hypothetical protein
MVEKTTEFVGSKNDYNKVEITLRFTQPVRLQSFGGEFDKNTGEENPKTRGVPLKALRLGNEPAVDGARRTYYRSEVGKLLHLRRWSRSEMANALRDLTRYKTNTLEMRIEVVHRAVRYATATPNRGLLLAPSGTWHGNPQYAFKLRRYADASYKPYHDAAVSVGGHAVFLQDVPRCEKSKQQSTTLSVSEAVASATMESSRDGECIERFDKIQYKHFRSAH